MSKYALKYIYFNNVREKPELMFGTEQNWLLYYNNELVSVCCNMLIYDRLVYLITL